MLTAGMAVGQMIFHRSAPVPHEKGYAVRWRYNGDRSVQGGEGMSILTNVTGKDAAALIVQGIKAGIEAHIVDELRHYLQPRINAIAREQAEKVCKEAVLEKYG